MRALYQVEGHKSRHGEKMEKTTDALQKIIECSQIIFKVLWPSAKHLEGRALYRILNIPGDIPLNIASNLNNADVLKNLFHQL